MSLIAARYFLLTGLLATVLQAGETKPPASVRYRELGATEVPDFQQHISPLLGRLGCNGRACHGSFQGKGGLQLSLFGYDLQKDHAAVRSRINAGSPSASLLLKKPLEIVAHEGGQRLPPGSWQQHMLQRWITDGGRIGKTKELRSLSAEPQELVLAAQQSDAIRITALWKDGTAEDVTCLCRLTTRDDGIARVDDSGHVFAVATGDTHLVIAYDREVISVPILVPRSTEIPPPPSSGAARTTVDRLVAASHHRLGIVPSDICSDEDFLRRVSIDLTGTLPTPAEVTTFLADSSPDRRTRIVERLLASPAYAGWWANRLCDMTGNNPFRQQDGRIGHELARQWYEWIYSRVATNQPYDRIVAGIVLAESRSPRQTYTQFAEDLSSYLREDAAGDITARTTMPYYWTRRNLEQPDDRALAFAHSFMGIRLQCAQCHKHPFDRWTQQDFRDFSRIFAAFEFGIRDSAKSEFESLLKASGQPANGRQRGQVTQEAAALAAEGRTVAWREFFFVPGRGPSGSVSVLGTTLHIEQDSDPRQALMAWMRHPDNPWFARAFVNRVWSNYFHRGIIDPPDDLNRANPPSNAALLKYLCDGFVQSGFDMQWLHREIVLSDTYQRDWRPTESNRSDRRHFSRAIPRRMPAEVVYDALKQVTAADSELTDVRETPERRAVGHLATRMAGTYAQRVFGQPERLTACDCERSNSPSLLQAVFLQNDPLIQVRLKESGWLKQIEADPAPDQQKYIQQAYLRTVCRNASPEELRQAREHLAESPSVRAGIEDLLWALINSKEFILNH